MFYSDPRQKDLAWTTSATFVHHLHRQRWYDLQGSQHKYPLDPAGITGTRSATRAPHTGRATTSRRCARRAIPIEHVKMLLTEHDFATQGRA